LWASVKEDVLLIAVDGGRRAVREFRTRGGTPEVDAIVSQVVEEFKSMFEAIEVHCVWGHVRL
jgi:hypothetical protein